MTDVLVPAVATEVRLPHVNLLPSEIGERRALRRLQVVLGGAVVLALVGVGAAYSSAASQVSEARGELDASRARTQSLQTRINGYATVPATYAAVEAARSQLAEAVSTEVRWSYRLNELSLTIPDGVWLTSLTVARSAPVTPATGQPADAAVAPVAPIAGLTFTGAGRSYEDVAAWLDSVAQIRDAAGRLLYRDVALSTASEAPIGTTPSVSFASTANLTRDALSQRATSEGGK